MLAIKKADKPEFFKSYVEDPSQKKALRDYILEKEQQHLCCYCETQISGNREDSILEHIRPIDDNRKGRETIDILNLNQAKLKQARRTLFKQLIKMIRAGNLDDCLAYFKEYPAFVDYVKENYQG